jgi:hypothetical protein
MVAGGVASGSDVLQPLIDSDSRTTKTPESFLKQDTDPSLVRHQIIEPNERVPRDLKDF